MRINRKILIAIVGFVIVAAAGALGLGKLGGFALIKNSTRATTRTRSRRRMLPKTCRS